MTTDPFDADSWKERLRERGLRATGPRLQVLRALASSPEPLTVLGVLALANAEANAEEGEADRVTVYRTLNSFVEAGLVHKVDPGDRIWRFGLLSREGEEHRGHAHFVCDDCGVVRCLAQAEISVSVRGSGPSRDKLHIKQQDVYLHGTCESCQRDEAPSKRGKRRAT